MEYTQPVQTTVTCFLHCGDSYLMLKRSLSKKIDPGKLNGVGGRLEKGENYLDAAIREVKEETGYDLSEKDARLCGVVKLEQDNSFSFNICFFKFTVHTKEIPLGNITQDGELIWIDKNSVLKGGYDLVDDLNYVFDDIVNDTGIFFLTASADENLKIYYHTKSSVSCY